MTNIVWNTTLILYKYSTLINHKDDICNTFTIIIEKDAIIYYNQYVFIEDRFHRGIFGNNQLSKW